MSTGLNIQGEADFSPVSQILGQVSNETFPAFLSPSPLQDQILQKHLLTKTQAHLQKTTTMTVAARNSKTLLPRLIPSQQRRYLATTLTQNLRRTSKPNQTRLMNFQTLALSMEPTNLLLSLFQRGLSPLVLMTRWLGTQLLARKTKLSVSLTDYLSTQNQSVVAFQSWATALITTSKAQSSSRNSPLASLPIIKKLQLLRLRETCLSTTRMARLPMQSTLAQLAQRFNLSQKSLLNTSKTGFLPRNHNAKTS